MQNWRMTIPGEKILVAVSGGPDSTALLHVLKVLAAPLQITLGVAHLNHGLRESAADHDERFVAAMARDMGYPFHTRTVNVIRFQQEGHLSREEAARILRYRFFDEIMTTAPYDRVATGHNADDNAEQVLMNMIRGSGPLGLAGIPPIRNGHIIRPLIRLTRREIETALKQESIPYTVDASNRDPAFLRNRIRHEVIPLLRNSYNPAITESIGRTALIMRAEENWLSRLVATELKKVITHRSPNALTLDRKALAGLHIALRRRIYRAAIAAVKGNSRKISWPHIESIDRITMAADAPKFLDLPAQIRVLFHNRSLIVKQETSPLREHPPSVSDTDSPRFAYRLDGPGTIKIMETGGTVKMSQTMVTDQEMLTGSGPNTAFFDKKNVCFPITIRSIRPGDRFMPLGMQGTKKVNTFLADSKVPRMERAAIPVLVSMDSIVWVAGKRIDHRARVRSTGIEVLTAEFMPTEGDGVSE